MSYLNKVEDFLAELARLTPSEVLIVENVDEMLLKQ